MECNYKIECNSGMDMYTVVEEYHKRFLEVTRSIKESYPDTVDGYYNPEYLRELLTYLPEPEDMWAATFIIMYDWGFIPDYTRAPYYLPKLVAAYERNYLPEESNSMITFMYERTYLRFVEEHLCPRPFVEAVLKYYDEHGHYYKAPKVVDDIDAVGLPNSDAGDFARFIDFSDYAVSRYKTRQDEKERAAKEAKALEAAEQLKNRVWSYSKEPSLPEAASLIDIIEFATSNPGLYADLRQRTDNNALVERLYSMIKESYEMLLACGFSYEDPLPELDYGSPRDLWQSLSRARIVCSDAVQTAIDKSSESSMSRLNLF